MRNLICICVIVFFSVTPLASSYAEDDDELATAALKYLSITAEYFKGEKINQAFKECFIPGFYKWLDDPKTQSIFPSFNREIVTVQNYDYLLGLDLEDLKSAMAALLSSKGRTETEEERILMMGLSASSVGMMRCGKLLE